MRISTDPKAWFTSHGRPWDRPVTSFRWWARLARDGYFLCQICFEEQLMFEAYTDAEGDAWDVCRECYKLEREVAQRLAADLIPPVQP